MEFQDAGIPDFGHAACCLQLWEKEVSHGNQVAARHRRSAPGREPGRQAPAPRLHRRAHVRGMRSAGSRGLPRPPGRGVHHRKLRSLPGSRQGAARGVRALRRPVDADRRPPRCGRHGAASLRRLPAGAGLPGAAAPRPGPCGAGARRLDRGGAPLPRARRRPLSRRGGAGGAVLGGSLEVQGERRSRRAGRDRRSLQDPLHGQLLGEESLDLGRVSGGLIPRWKLRRSARRGA